ncbi:MAG: ribosome biogenesis GTPase Der [Evtepia sp.]|uniref:ribosome biogenesis GTPase Der n=1 Tax=Evtepia sp. TaxID=2773933 RepID=UPI002985B777|nr:ribosome biogenesis GTPase Der [Evtepia sp.]MDD7289689.1 ribosome biogenesis GTPase Der [Clostridiales bacterium]MDY4431313.1 ribosome biogenesis GTPase Der [Evtepia sp.]
MSKPLVAIVGRPNVGKSMLFNKLVGRRLSIVEDTPGVTRDRLYAECEWRGRTFDIVDTGGIEPGTTTEILTFMRKQAEIAISHANVIVFLCDIKTGLTASDQDVANMLLKARKPVVLAVNKMDQVGMTNPDIYEFYNLGLGDPIAVSAVHGHGTGDLLDACFEHFPPEEEEEEETDLIKVAVIGKPNVGKSSLINKILGEERVIVSNMAGTTRDAVDSYFENETGKFLFIDTAGMRKKSKVNDQIEKFSVLRAAMAIERADVCLIMIDANEGVTEQDTKVAGMAHEAGKACIIVVNKWDAVEKDDKTMDKMRENIRRDLAYMSYAPIVFISALTGQRVPRLFQLIKYVDDQAAMRITTGMLNSLLADATARVQPPSDKGRRLKIYYMTQAGTRPPHFVCFCNDAKLFHFSYQRYLENQIRNTFGLEGTPIRLTIRQKGDKEG